MSKKEENWVDVSPTDVKGFTKPGSVIGYYVSTEHNKGPKNNSCIHTFQTDDGERIALWGATVLDDLLTEVNRGDRVKVTYKGMVKTKSGTGEYKSFSVQVDQNASRPEGLGPETSNSLDAAPVDDLGANEDIKDVPEGTSEEPLEDDGDNPFE